MTIPVNTIAQGENQIEIHNLISICLVWFKVQKKNNFEAKYMVCTYSVRYAANLQVRVLQCKLTNITSPRATQATRIIRHRENMC